MSGGRLVYESLNPITSEEAESVFRTGQPREISRALLRLSLHGPDWGLAERRALEFLSHPDAWVRRNAATSLGHISRLARKLDVDTAVPALLALMADEEASAWAGDAPDDIEHYLKIDRRRFIGREKSAVP